MKKIKEMIISLLMKEYDELDALRQVCFAEIEEIKVVKITYENGVVEYLEQEGDALVKHKT